MKGRGHNRAYLSRKAYKAAPLKGLGPKVEEVSGGFVMKIIRNSSGIIPIILVILVAIVALFILLRIISC